MKTKQHLKREFPLRALSQKIDQRFPLKTVENKAERFVQRQSSIPPDFDAACVGNAIKARPQQFHSSDRAAGSLTIRRGSTNIAGHVPTNTLEAISWLVHEG